MKRSNFWLWSNICTSFAAVSLMSFLMAPTILPKIVPFFKSGGSVLAGNVFMIIGFVIVILGVAAGWVSYFIGNEKLCLISNIACNVGEILSLGFFLLFVPGIALGYIAYFRMRKESKKSAS